MQGEQFEKAAYVVACFIPLFHLLRLVIKTKGVVPNFNPQQMIDPLKVGFVYNVITAQIVIVILQWSIDAKYHPESFIWWLLIGLSTYLVYWGLLIYFIHLSIVRDSTITLSQKVNLILFALSQLITFTIQCRVLGVGGCLVCTSICVVKTVITVFFTFHIILSNSFYVDLSVISGQSNTHDSYINVKKMDKAYNLKNLRVINFKEVQRYDKITLNYIVNFSYNDQPCVVERSFREFVHYYRDLRVNSKKPVFNIPLRKYLGKNLTITDIYDRMNILQQFLNSIVLIKENEFTLKFFNVNLDIPVYTGYSKTTKVPSRKVNPNHKHTIPEVIWEDELGEASQGSALASETMRERGLQRKSYDSQKYHTLCDSEWV